MTAGHAIWFGAALAYSLISVQRDADLMTRGASVFAAAAFLIVGLTHS